MYIVRKNVLPLLYLYPWYDLQWTRIGACSLATMATLVVRIILSRVVSKNFFLHLYFCPWYAFHIPLRYGYASGWISDFYEWVYWLKLYRTKSRKYSEREIFCHFPFMSFFLDGIRGQWPCPLAIYATAFWPIVLLHAVWSAVVMIYCRLSVCLSITLRVAAKEYIRQHKHLIN